MLHSKTIETIVGAFILVGFGALLVLAMRVSNLSFASMTENGSYTVTAHFDNVGGLKVRSPVKMAGVVIGRVSNISFDSTTYEAVAALAIDSRYSDIPTDTTASIYTAGLLGEQYVGLEAGGADEFLQEGDQITLTESAVVLERIIGQFLYDKGKGD